MFEASNLHAGTLSEVIGLKVKDQTSLHDLFNFGSFRPPACQIDEPTLVVCQRDTVTSRRLNFAQVSSVHLIKSLTVPNTHDSLLNESQTLR